MGIEVFPDSPSVAMSPRISFSHDISQNDTVPVEQYIRSGSSSSIDFDFCVFRESFDQESSSADELFFDGKILPIEIKRRLAPSRRAADPPPPSPPPRSPLPPSRPPPPPQIQKTTETEEKQNYNKSTSFWRFKRSSSLNCGSGYGGSLCPLPLLSRSNSTGSTASGKRTLKQNLLKKQSQSSSSTSHQKPPLKKNSYASSNYNGVKINPVLNVPPANLFGLGYIFSGGKDKNNRKK